MAQSFKIQKLPSAKITVCVKSQKNVVVFYVYSFEIACMPGRLLYFAAGGNTENIHYLSFVYTLEVYINVAYLVIT